MTTVACAWHVYVLVHLALVVELLVSQLASVLELAYSVGVATEVLYGTLPRQLFEPNFSEFKILYNS